MIVEIKANYPNCPAKIIKLQGGKIAIVDPDKYDSLLKYHWYAKKSGFCWYAVAKVKKGGIIFFLRMHRLIAQTPADQVCHHINHNPLDNRILNLQNMTWFEHAKYYSWR